MELRALIASVLIGGMFGSATATVDAIGEDVMIVDIEVEVTPATETVIAHLSFEDDAVLRLPMLDRGDGVFGIRTELEPKNYFVVFELVGEDGESSDPVSLTEMGADLSGDAASPTTTTAEGDDGLGEESRQMLWLAVALGAASLSALAFWVLGGRDEDKEEPDEPGEATEKEGASEEDG